AFHRPGQGEPRRSELARGDDDRRHPSARWARRGGRRRARRVAQGDRGEPVRGVAAPVRDHEPVAHGRDLRRRHPDQEEALVSILATIAPNAVLYLAAALFAVGLVGVACRRNILVMLLSVEIMINAANLAFVAFSKVPGDVT